VDSALFDDKKISIVAAGCFNSGAVTEDGVVLQWGDQGAMSIRMLHARAGRWHNERPDHALAFMMQSNLRLGSDAQCFAKVLPCDVDWCMFKKMQFQPHEDTPHTLRDMMGQRSPPRVVALDHDAPVLSEGEDRE